MNEITARSVRISQENKEKPYVDQHGRQNRGSAWAKIGIFVMKGCRCGSVVLGDLAFAGDALASGADDDRQVPRFQAQYGGNLAVGP